MLVSSHGIIFWCMLILLSLIAAKTTAETEQNPFVDIFGTTLYKWSAKGDEIMEQNTTALLKGKSAVAIYYSASWCGPCKQFTPVLAEFYASMNKKGKKFEVVWVSRDNSEDAFVQYYQKMPWLAVTIENIPKCVEKTSAKYQVRGIPHLVVLDGYDATVYTLDGRGKVAQDPYGLEFPWRPRTPGMLLKRILPSSVRTLVTGQLAAAKGRIVTFLRGVLESFLPPSLVSKLVGR